MRKFLVSKFIRYDKVIYSNSEEDALNEMDSINNFGLLNIIPIEIFEVKELDDDKNEKEVKENKNGIK